MVLVLHYESQLADTGAFDSSEPEESSIVKRIKDEAVAVTPSPPFVSRYRY